MLSRGKPAKTGMLNNNSDEKGLVTNRWESFKNFAGSWMPTRGPSWEGASWSSMGRRWEGDDLPSHRARPPAAHFSEPGGVR